MRNSLLTLFVFIVAFAEGQTAEPVIGMIALTLEPIGASEVNYIEAGYVKYAQSGGAQVVPIRLTDSWEVQSRLLAQVNGVFFTGGGTHFFTYAGTPTSFLKAACRIINYIKQQNDAGWYYPIWGSCQGFETLQICEVQMTNSVLSDVKGTPTYHNRVTFTDKAVGSKLFTMLEQPDYALNVMEDLSQNDIGIYGHSFGTFPETYASNSVINEAFDVLATSLDLNGVEILAIIEWKKYPFFAVQFHPERNMFNWEKEVYVHSLESLEASSYLSQAFATAARKNINKFSSQEELRKLLIRNWKPVFVHFLLFQIIIID